MILAVDQGNAIGWQDGRLPWKISRDMLRFKALTTGSTVVMGRKTFESLGRPQGLPNRQNVVITTQKHDMTGNPLFFRDGKDPFRSFVQVHQACLGCEPADLWVIGGGTLYDAAIEQSLVDEIYLTLVHTNSGADVQLKHDLAAWKLFVLREQSRGNIWNVAEYEQHQVEGDVPAVTFITLKKQK
jgi:dihydrofolate reductase